jgi:myo-inositol-1(or 4)-monophosphatase
MNNLSSMSAIVKEAGAYMLGSSEVESIDKSNAKDFVTISDIKSQAIIKARLREIEPYAIILSEEDTEDERKPMYTPDFTGYVLDPIDGTFNFKRNMKESAISIGYIENGQPIRGAIYDPYKDELYTAEKTKGAFCNDKQITVSQQKDISSASIATSNSYDDAAMARNLRRHISIYEQTGYMPWTNCPGSGVLIMTNIAQGRFDLYHHNGLKPWDNAAAFLIVEEAGGIIRTLDGSVARFTDNAIVMGNEKLVLKLLDILSKIDAELLR